AGRLAGLLAEVELQLRPLLAQPREHCRKQEWRNRRDDAHAQLAMERLAFRPCKLGKLLGLAQHLHRLVRHLLAKGGEANDATGALDESDAKKRFQFTKACGKRRLGDEAGVGRLSEMA